MLNSSYPMKMNLKLFGHSDGEGGAGGEGTPAAATPPAGGTTGQQAAVDYDKIQQMLAGALAAKEDTALKAYFKQQGLSQEEAEKAMATFKQQKAAQQPDAAKLQTQLTQYQTAAQAAQLDSRATLKAVGLGLDAKTIPYVLKLADFSQAVGEDGKINDEAIETALNKVLEDVPNLKPQPGQANGFVQVGATGGQQTQNTDDALKAAFGITT